METAVLVEIEKLRRASLSALREKYRRCSARRRNAGIASICSGASPGGCRRWRKAIYPNAPGSGPARSPGMPI